MAECIKWTDTQQFHQVVRSLKQNAEHTGDDLPTIVYKGKVKLHGTNAGIQIHPDGTVIAQSRSKALVDGEDNAGFGQWVKETEDYWKSLSVTFGTTVVYGEWVGPGVNNGTSAHQIKEKIFAVFAVQFTEGDGVPKLYTQPTMITVQLHNPVVPRPSRVHVLPWYGEGIGVDYSDPLSVSEATEKINKMVMDVEECDPWVKETFGIEGVGEGLVFYPVNLPEDVRFSREYNTRLLFKAKGQKHSVSKVKVAATSDPTRVASALEFAEFALGLPRLEQGVTEACDDVVDLKKTGAFLKWIAEDVQKECSLEMEDSGLTWKDVSKYVSSRARDWYLNKAKE